MNEDAVLPRPISHRFIRLRLPIVLLTLVVIVYFCITIVTQIRLGIVGLTELSDPSNIQKVLEVVPNTSASQMILPGDRIIAVDRWPIRFNVDWHNFYPIKDSFELTLQRNEEVLTVSVLTISPALDELASRVILPVISVLTWIVGALILLLATPKNYEAWHAGFVILSMALVMVGIAALVHEIPGGQIVSGGLMTIAAVGFAELALFPNSNGTSRSMRRFFRVAYAGALFVSAVNLFDILILRPAGIRLYNLTGIVPLRLALFYAAVFLIMNPALTVARYVRLPHSYIKRQLRTLMLGALAAFGPLVFFVIVPSLIIPDGKPLIPYQIAFLFITLLPATFGYVIYRHKYLGLDVLVTQTSGQVENIKALIDAAEKELADNLSLMHGLKEDSRRYKKLKLDGDEIEARIDQLEARKESLESEIAGQVMADEDIRDIVMYSRDAMEGIDNPTFEQKRRWIEVLQVQVVLTSQTTAKATCILPGEPLVINSVPS